ncbi:MAG: phenylalanine--tRNA ligase subunit alpha [Oligoflexales bacterium]|nr:phenylalanine--tRNA ligase subunit alpha [Oligoflexales bacterium]
MENFTKKISEVRQLFEQAFTQTLKSEDAKAVEQLRIDFLGRKGPVQELLASLKNATPESKPILGKHINELRIFIEGQLEELKNKARAWQLAALLNAEAIDLSLPVADEKLGGALHPVTLMRRILLKEFHRLGFSVYAGPEAEYEQFNFNALNIPDHHPARDMQDTFHIDGYDKLVLRTHTSPVQIHAMLRERPPLRIIAPGRVFRCDSDPTHTPMFHQIEALVVDEDISFADLKGTIDVLLKSIFGTELNTRLRPSYFPFTEPSAEVDLNCVLCQGKDSQCRVCKGTGWLEVGGCGMVHPNVFEAVNIDSERYTGFAFGFGIDRLAMLKYRLNDLRTLFESNYQFLSQFPLYS